MGFHKLAERIVAGICFSFINLGAQAQIHQLSQGWNLVGNDTGLAITSATIFGTPTAPTATGDAVASVWVWDAAASRWSFFSPSLSSTDLASYAASKGYAVLTTVPTGAGFWVHANKSASLNLTNAIVVNGFPITYKGIRIDALSYAPDSSDRCNASLTFTNTTTGPLKPYLYFDIVVNNITVSSRSFNYDILAGTTAKVTNRVYDSSFNYFACGTFFLRFNDTASFML